MSISPKLRNQIMMLDDFTCVYCGYRGADVTVDHFIPASLGGPDIEQNLVAACPSCNSIKGFGHNTCEIRNRINKSKNTQNIEAHGAVVSC